MDNDTLKSGCVVGMIALAVAAFLLRAYLFWVGIGMGLFFVLGIVALIYASKRAGTASGARGIQEGRIEETLTELFTKNEAQKLDSLLRSQNTLRLPKGVAREKIVKATRALLKVRAAAEGNASRFLPPEVRDDAVRHSIGSAQALFSLVERLSVASQISTEGAGLEGRFAEINREADTITAASERTLAEFTKLTVGFDDEAIAAARRQIDSVAWQAAEMTKLEQMLARPGSAAGAAAPSESSPRPPQAPPQA